MANDNKQVSGWVGWIGFASLMLLIGGGFSFFMGIIALFKDTVYVNAANGSLYVLTYVQWGWIHIIAGFLALLAAGSLARGNYYGRIFSVLIALIGLFVNMAFVPVYPLWSIILMVIDIMVIWAVIVHGKEVKNLQ